MADMQHAVGRLTLVCVGTKIGAGGEVREGGGCHLNCT